VQSSETEDQFAVEHGYFQNSSQGERTPATVVRPLEVKNPSYLIWLNDRGKSSIRVNGEIAPDVRQCGAAGLTVVAIDCYWQGDLLPSGADPARCRLVENGRGAAGYTFGYNDCAFVRQVHDVLNVVAGLDPHDQETIHLLATDGMGPVGAAARAMAGKRIDRAAIDTQGFRFAQVEDLRDVRFLPGGAKFGDLPGLIAMGSPNPVWIAGEPPQDNWIDCVYSADCATANVYRAASGESPLDWLLHNSSSSADGVQR
jgi:hypothetical protein